MRYQQSNERRAVILMVVLSLLTLFAIVGLTFVLYADAEAASARVARQAETQQHADVPPQQALAFFLSQLIYDVPDATGYGSAMRGHSLARTMFGYNDKNLAGNTTPYNGVGRLHTNGGTTWPYMNPFGIDDFQLINYTYFAGDGFARDPEWYGPQQAAPFVGQGTSTYYVGCNAPYTYPDFNNLFLAAIRSDGVVLAPSFHRAYTGANFFGTLDPSNPNWYSSPAPTPTALRYQVLRPRPADHNGFPAPEDAGGDVRNVPWSKGGTDPITSKPFQNDSMWMDFGAPVMTAPDGTMYKMMFAPCIIDLDNRLHVGAAGNIKGGNIASRSNHGWFPSEVNLSMLWSTSASPADWLNVFLGNPAVTPPTGYYGKYGQNQIPSGALFPTTPSIAGQLPTGSPAHWYSQADTDGGNEQAGGAPTGSIFLPGTNPLALATIPFPYFPQGYGSGSGAERTNHPAAYTAFTASGGDLVFSAADMEQVLRPNSTLGATVDSGSSALISYLTRLAPNTLGANTANTQIRNWITTISADVTKPGLSPWIYDPVNAASYPATTPPTPPPPYAVNAATPFLPPLGGTLPFPAFAQRQTNVSPAGSDFITADWRTTVAAAVAALGAGGRIDLNQQLTPFPHMLSGTTLPMMTSTPTDRFDMANPTNPVNTAALILARFQAAMQQRQQLATNLYLALLYVTGVPPPSNVATPTVADLAPRRWLAQLAVNIVDYIDDDEISTPFNFFDPGTGLPASPVAPTTPYQVDNPKNLLGTATATTLPANGFNDAGLLTGVAPYPAYYAPGAYNPDVPVYWVFGTELPRVVINEVLGEYSLPTMPGTSPPQAAAGTFNVNLWVELFNPLPPAATVTGTATANTGSALGLQALDSQPVPLYQPATAGVPAYNPYQIVIANNNNASPTTYGLWADPNGGLNNNVLGTPLQLRYSTTPTAANLGGVPAICNFAEGAGMAGTVATPAALNYPIAASVTGGASGGLAGQSYMIVGPSATDVNNDITVANNNVLGTTPILASPTGMSYQVTFTPPNQWSITPPQPAPAAGNPLVTIPISDNVPGGGVSVLLRRLANPHLPPNPFTAAGGLINPLMPPNPYITVDYVQGVPLNGYGMDQVKKVPVSVNTFAAPIPINNNLPPQGGNQVQASYGKFQPYASNANIPPNVQFASQSTAKVGTAGLTDLHTLGSSNQPLATPFTWLVHLDRMLISPMELLHVSGFAPHLLTQRFITSTADTQKVLQPYNYTIPTPLSTPPGTPPAGFVAANYSCFQHYAPWFNQANRLYRFFEVVQTHDGASGTPDANGRVPGLVNINTLWDPPLNMSANPPTTLYPLMYQAICDPSATPNNPNFTGTNANTIFQTLLTLRTPGLASATLSQADRPFLGMAAGVTPVGDTQYPTTPYGFPDGNGINHTLFTNATALPGSVPPPPGQWPPSPLVPALQLPNTSPTTPQVAHPYLQNELLTKVYNRFTTRSNVFAVFVTVGFFQVTGTVPGTTIPQLGPEIGRSEGRQIRHRMFAIVDRSQLKAFTGPMTTPYDPRNDAAVVPYFSIID